MPQRHKNHLRALLLGPSVRTCSVVGELGNLAVADQGEGRGGPATYLRVWMTPPPPPFLKIWIRHCLVVDIKLMFSNSLIII